MTSPAWHAEARKLRAGGMIHREIAKALGKREETVRYVLCNANEKRQERERAAKVRGAPSSSGPRKILDYDALPEAALAFARGEITRAQLMARISGRDRWEAP